MSDAIAAIDPHAAQPTSLVALIQSLWRNRYLIAQMTRRDVVGRYKGSVLGLVWSFLTPILMLVVYTFVFSVVFKARWGTDGDESKTGRGKNSSSVRRRNPGSGRSEDDITPVVRRKRSGSKSRNMS